MKKFCAFVLLVLLIPFSVLAGPTAPAPSQPPTTASLVPQDTIKFISTMGADFFQPDTALATGCITGGDGYLIVPANPATEMPCQVAYPVKLPLGTIVTKITLFAKAATDNLTASLYRTKMDELPSKETLGSNSGSATIIFGDNFKIEERYAYWISVDIPSDRGMKQEFYGFTVEYMKAGK